MKEIIIKVEVHIAGITVYDARAANMWSYTSLPVSSHPCLSYDGLNLTTSTVVSR